MAGFFCWNFFGEIFLEDFLGGSFWEDFFIGFLGGFFWEDFFGRIFFGGFFWEEFFVYIGIDLMSRFWILSRFCLNGEGRKEEGQEF